AGPERCDLAITDAMPASGILPEPLRSDIKGYADQIKRTQQPGVIAPERPRIDIGDAVSKAGRSQQRIQKCQKDQRRHGPIMSEAASWFAITSANRTPVPTPSQAMNVLGP